MSFEKKRQARTQAEKCSRCGEDAGKQLASTEEGLHTTVIWGHPLCLRCCAAWYETAPATMINKADPGDLEDRVEAAAKRWEAWTQEWAKRGAA